MDDVKLVMKEDGEGSFVIKKGEEQIGEMGVSIAGGSLTVFHTEVDPQEEGKGYAKKMLEAMAEHARANHLKVNPLCSYVHQQFKHNPEAFADIWDKS